MARLILTLLGGFQARVDPGPALSLPTRKAQALLAYLALPLGQAHPRDKLAALLWGGIREESARASLRQALFAIRKALGEAEATALRQDADTLALDSTAVDTDVAVFERAVGEGTAKALEQAAALYRGDLLAGLAVDEAPFEEWLLGERERLRELALEGLAKLLAHQRKMEAIEAAIQTALKLLTLEPLQEPVHRTLMRLYAQSGRRGSALRQYQQCVSVLGRELGVEPEAETKQLYQEILRARPHRATADAPVERRATPRVVEHRAPGAGGETELIGRAAEMAQLRAALDSVAAGDVRVVAVLGEAGIGKSRLVAELAADATACGVTVLLGRAYESEQTLPFGSWVDALRAGRIADDAELLAHLDTVLRPELARLLPEVGGGPPPASGPTDVRLIFESVTQLIGHLASRHPLLIVLEDLHWADEMSTRLVAFVGRRLVDRPAIVVMTAREEEIVDAPALRQALDDLQREGRLTRLVLRSLSRSDTLALVRAVARSGDEETLGQLGEHAWAASEGNPFVAVETVRAHAEGAWVGRGERLALPERVRETVGRRLERLSERAQALAAVAAVIGREFEFALLQRAAGLGEEETADGMEELVRRRVLQGLGERFDFTHDRIREVAYGRLLSPRRKLLHRRIAEALETSRTDDPDIEALALGLHYREAELWDKAVEYLRQAGLTASRRGAYRDAARCFEQTLTALKHLPESRERTERTYDVTAELRGTTIPLGDLPRQLEALREMEALAEALGDRVRLASVLGSTVYTVGALGDHVRALETAERGRALAVEVGNLQAQVGTDAMMARAYYAMGRYSMAIEAARRSFGALTGALAYEYPSGAIFRQSVGGRVWAAMSLAEQGHFAEANACAEEAIEIAETDKGTHERVWSWFGGGRVALVQGELERAVGRLTPILPLARGNLGVYVSRIASTLGSVRLLAGRIIEAVPLLEQAAEHGQSIGFMHGHSLVLALLAEGYLRAERFDDASRTAAEALALARKHGERGWEAWALRVLGEIAAERSPADAATHYGDALALATELGMRPLQAHCHRGLARVTGAQAEVNTAIELYRAMDMTFWLRRAEAGASSAEIDAR